MSVDLSQCLVIGISSRALFSLEPEHAIFTSQGIEAYSQFQIDHEEDILRPGAAFPLVQALLQLNHLQPDKRMTEVIIMSRNSADTSLRIFNSIKHYGLDISRAALTGGAPLSSYLSAFNVDLFLSASAEDVQSAINAGVAAGQLYGFTGGIAAPLDQIRIAFDGDAVLFSEEAELIYQNHGLDAFTHHERLNARRPLPEGPFAKFIKTLSYLQHEFPVSPPPIRTALITARNSPSHERVIRTLRSWNVRIDEAFFMGGVPKAAVIQSFGAHIFFDDQEVHCRSAATVAPTARVPYKTSAL